MVVSGWWGRGLSCVPDRALRCLLSVLCAQAFPSFLLNTTASHGDMVALAEQVQAQNAAAAKAKAGHR